MVAYVINISWRVGSILLGIPLCKTKGPWVLKYKAALKSPKRGSATSTATTKGLGVIWVRAIRRFPASAQKKKGFGPAKRKTAHDAAKHSKETCMVRSIANSNGHARCKGIVFSESRSAESTGSIECYEAIQV